MRILIENEQHEIFMRQENIKFYANEISKILIFYTECKQKAESESFACALLVQK